MNPHIQAANFVYIKNFISNERACELAKEFIKFSTENNLTGDGQAPNSSKSYNYISFLELLCEKTPEVSKFLGETVLPTYAYARVYKEGSELLKHRDREACDISLTLHLSKDEDWPIWIEKPNGESVSLDLDSGDAMMYLGCEADHWREKFKGKEYVQVFLHYVRSRGPNSWAYFDNKLTQTNNLPGQHDKSIDGLVSPSNNLPQKINVGDHVESLKDYICIFENLISDELCDEILQEYKNCEDWFEASVGHGVINKSIRNVNQIGLSSQPVIEKNQPVRKKLDDKLWEVTNKAIGMYNQKFPEARIEEDSGYELLEYKTGCFYTTHTDSYKLQPRAVSCSIAINDSYEGGEFAFFDRKLKYSLKKGSVIMFPSNFMFPHEILPVTSGTRYSIITWFI